MSECTHDCGNCSENCESRDPKSFLEELNQYSKVNKVIGVVSGKGGVGKSLVTALMAAAMNRTGKRTAILDADVTGPSIPKLFGIKDKAQGSELGILPGETEKGTKIISVNMLLENDDATCL